MNLEKIIKLIEECEIHIFHIGEILEFQKVNHEDRTAIDPNEELHVWYVNNRDQLLDLFSLKYPDEFTQWKMKKGK